MNSDIFELNRFACSYLAKEGIIVAYHAFLHAVCNERITDVKKFINLGVDVNYDDSKALFRAVEKGNTEITKLLIDAGADVNNNENRALSLASAFGLIEIVKLLIDAGADIHYGEDSAMKLAVRSGHTGIVSLLYDLGSSIYFDDYNLCAVAAEGGHAEMLRFLVKLGAYKEKHAGLLIDAAAVSESIDILNYVIELTKGCLEEWDYERALTRAGDVKWVEGLNRICEEATS